MVYKNQGDSPYHTTKFILLSSIHHLYPPLYTWDAGMPGSHTFWPWAQVAKTREATTLSRFPVVMNRQGLKVWFEREIALSRSILRR